MATPPPPNSPPPTSAVAEEANHQGSESPEPDYHVFQPVLRTFTPLEARDDPALVVILADEGTLGQVLAIPSNPIPTRSGGPNPSTSAVTDWFGTLVAHHARSLRTEIEPEITANPPLPANVLLFHQLKGDEVDALLALETPPARSLGRPPAEDNQQPQGGGDPPVQCPALHSAVRCSSSDQITDNAIYTPYYSKCFVNCNMNAQPIRSRLHRKWGGAD